MEGNLQKTFHRHLKSHSCFTVFSSHNPQADWHIETVFVLTSKVRQEVDDADHRHNPEGWCKSHQEANKGIETDTNHQSCKNGIQFVFG
ncbi:hypothetical protein, partial [Clostridioides difficile]